MQDLNKTYLFRMTHIENIPHILQYGITHSYSPNANSVFVPIGDYSLISTRNAFLMNSGRRLGDYIPFYFGVRTPMLYVLQKGFNMVTTTSAENVVYCITSVQKIIDLKLDFIFTNGHAVDSFTTQYGPLDINNLDSIIDWKAVKAKYWIEENDLDLKRRKEAEFLILGDIDFTGILGFLVYNQNAKSQMISYGAKAESVVINSEYYF